jgi:hypothetical protein
MSSAVRRPRAMGRAMARGDVVVGGGGGVGVVWVWGPGDWLAEGGLVVVVVLLLRRMWTWGPGKVMVAAPMRVKVLFAVGRGRGAAMERRAVVVLWFGGR